MNASNKRNKFHSLNISLKNSLKKISPDKTVISQKSPIAVNTKNEEVIKKLMKDNKTLEKQLSEEKKHVKDLESKIKVLENEKTQLIIVLKLVENTGVDIESIVDEWNAEVQNISHVEMNSNKSHNSSYIHHHKNKKNKKDNYSCNNTLSYDNNNNNSNNSVLNSSNFLPLNLEEPNCKQQLCNNHTYSNIPKLNFDKIKMSQQKCKYNITGAEEIKNDNNNNVNKDKDKNQEQALFKERNKRKFNNISASMNNNNNNHTSTNNIINNNGKKNKKDK